MEIPKPPEDEELHNIIDKLAQFVARNGPEFEQMTKDKQKENPRFYFLFGGEFYNYYKFRVNSEQMTIRNNQELHQTQQQINAQTVGQQILSSGQTPKQPNIWQNNGINNMNNNLAPNVLTQQINELQEQIRQSETNLMAQHQVLMQHKKIMIDDAIHVAQDEHLRRMAEDFNVNLNEFENVLQPIADSCTKESIANGKIWIFNHCNAHIHYDIIARYLLKRITSMNCSFDAKLHLMYLINDLFNHCMRKGDDSLKRSLEKVIVPIFCCTYNEDDEDKQQKLTKLLKLWEMNHYFERTILDVRV